MKLTMGPIKRRAKATAGDIVSMEKAGSHIDSSIIRIGSSIPDKYPARSPRPRPFDKAGVLG